MARMMNKTIKKTKGKLALDAIKCVCESNLRSEVCGFLGWDEKEGFYVVREALNIAEEPEKYFLIDPLEYLLFKEDYDLIAVFHSHLIGDEKTSEFDKKMAFNSCNPFLIYSLNTEKINIYEPENMECNIDMLERIKELI